MATQKAPKEQVLPGTRGDRIKALDDVCAQIRDAMDAINDGNRTKKNLKPTVQRIMRETKQQTYVAHGVRVVYVQGHEDVTFKLVQGEATTKNGNKGKGKAAK